MLNKDKIDFTGPFNSLDELLDTLKAELESSGSDYPSDVVVFSPGATSFGMFTNEFDRGNTFMKKVEEKF